MKIWTLLFVLMLAFLVACTPQDPNLINGKTSDERLDEAIQYLHREGSEEHVRDNFLDLELVFVDNPIDYPEHILPFEYYYSAEVDRTFNICAIERTIFICEGKIDHVITDEEINTICVITPVYQDYEPPTNI